MHSCLCGRLGGLHRSCAHTPPRKSQHHPQDLAPGHETCDMLITICLINISFLLKQACKPRSYASSKLRACHLLTGVKCRATSVAKKLYLAGWSGRKAKKTGYKCPNSTKPTCTWSMLSFVKTKRLRRGIRNASENR